MAELWDGKTLELTSPSESLFKDKVKLFLQKYCGVEPVDVELKSDKSKAVVVFGCTEDAEKVLQTSPWQTKTSTFFATKVTYTECLVVRGFPDNNSEYVELFFECSDNGGGKIKRVDVRGSAYVVEFEDVRMVRSVMKRHEESPLCAGDDAMPLQLEVCDLQDVDRLLEPAEDLNVQQQSPDSQQPADTEDTQPTEPDLNAQQQSPDSQQPVHTEDSQPTEPAEYLNAQQQSPDSLQPADTEDTQPTEEGLSEPDVATPQPEPTENTEQKEAPQTSPSDGNSDTGVAECGVGLDLKPRAIKVTALPEGKSQEEVRIHFEVKKHSGGGPVEDVLYLPEERKAVIIYQESQVAERVYCGYTEEGLKFDGQDVIVSILKSIARPIDTSGQLEDNKLFLGHVEQGVGVDEVTKYFEGSLSSCRVKKVIFGSQRGCILVEFSKFPGFEAVYQLVCQKPLGRSMVEVEGVQPYTDVEIYGIEELTEEDLQEYFTDTESEVENIDIQSEFVQWAVVTFPDHAGARRMIQRDSHIVKGKPLTVQPHYSCLGILPPGRDVSQFPRAPVDLRLRTEDERVMNFLCDQQSARQCMDASMAALSATVDWQWSGGEVCITYTTPPSPTQYQPGASEWAGRVRAAWGAEHSRYVTREVEVGGEYWDEFCELYERPGIGVGVREELELGSHSVVVVGEPGTVDNRITEIQVICDRAAQTYNKRNDRVSEDVDLEANIIAMWLREFLFQKHSSVTFSPSRLGHHVRVSGKREDVRLVKEEIQSSKSKIIQERVTISELKRSFLKQDEARNYMKLAWHDASVHAVFELEPHACGLRLCALGHEELSKASEILEGAVVEVQQFDVLTWSAGDTETNIMSKLTEALKSDQRAKVMVKLSSRDRLDSLCGWAVSVVGCEDVMGEVVATVRRFITEQSVQHEFILMHPAEYALLQRHCQDEIATQLQKCGLKYRQHVLPDDTKQGFRVSCNAEGIRQTRAILEGLRQQIEETEHHVSTVGMARYFSEESGTAYLSTLQAQHQVVISRDDDIDDSLSSSLTTHIKVTFVSSHHNPKMLYIASGDITKINTDVIVNAANPQMQHEGGVARAISDAGGASIQEECLRHVRSNGELGPGEVYVSGPGTLACKHIIHTVGPRWSKAFTEDARTAQKRLTQAVQMPLKEANARMLESVAMPAISTGHYGFPTQQASHTLVDAIWEFLDSKSYSVKKVYIVEKSVEVVEACVARAKQFAQGNVMVQLEDLAPVPQIDASTSDQRPVARLCVLERQGQHQKYGFDLHDRIAQFGFKVCTVTDPSPAKLAGVREDDHIIEVNGEPCQGFSKETFDEKVKCSARELRLLVVDEETDSYCVNQGIAISSTSDKVRVVRPSDPQTGPRTLARGPHFWMAGDSEGEIVGKSGLCVRLVHGDITEQEVDAIVCLSTSELKLDAGEVSKKILKKAGKKVQAECKKKCPSGGLTGGRVVTTSGGKAWKSIYHSCCSSYGFPTAIQDLATVVGESVSEADNNQMSSIAIPALGTGNLSFPPVVSASLIYEELRKLQSPKSLKQVNVVVYKSDMIKAFENYTKELVRGKHIPRDPVKWKKCVKKDSIGANDLEVQLIQGSILKEEADVLVNVVSRELSMSKGSLSKKVLKQVGDEPQKQLKNLKGKLRRNGDVLKTTGGKGDWKKIYHTYLTHYEDKPEQAEVDVARYITNCLIEAEKDRYETLAFPVLGTGEVGIPVWRVTRLFYGLIGEFSLANPATCLKTVKIVVHQKKEEDYKVLRSHMEEVLGGRVRPLKAPVSVAADKEGVREASKPAGLASSHWKPGSKSTEIISRHDLKVEVCVGDIVTQQVDVIVNLTSNNLDLSNGIISKQILEKGGKKIQDELKKRYPSGVKPGEVAESPGGKLQCKAIYHGTSFDWENQQAAERMSEFVARCLEKAHKAELASIAFPAVGTGSLKFPFAESAKILLQCVSKFSKRHKVSVLKSVKLVVYKAEDCKSFEEALRGLLQGKRTVRHLIKDSVNFELDVKTDAPEKFLKRDVKFRIFGMNKDSLKLVKSEIDKKCRTEIHEESVDSTEDIQKLSPEDIEMIMGLESKRDVTLSVDKDQNLIVIRGLRDIVKDVHSLILKVFLKNKEQHMLQQNKALAQKTQWEFEENGEWYDYEEDINTIIETAHSKKSPFAEWQELDEECDPFTVRVAFNSMTELTEGGPKRNFGVRSRNQKGSEVVSLPNTWRKMTEGTKCDVVALDRSSEEYKDVERKFYMSMASYRYEHIEKIERVQNPQLYRNFQNTRSEMRKRQKSDKELQRTVWHATDKDVLPKINDNGFNRSFAGDKYGKRFGSGVYFARDASYSARHYSKPDSAGLKYLYMAQILSGDYVEGSEDMKEPPPREPNKPELYDSVVNDEHDPTIFVIFDDTKMYPEYVITFKQ